MNKVGTSHSISGKFVRYVLIGGGSVLLYLLLFRVARKTLELDQWASVIFAYSPVLAATYVAQNFYTFRFGKIDLRSGRRFLITTLIGLGILLITAEVLATHFKVEELLANGIGAVLAPIVTFMLQNFWTFSGPKDP